MEKTILKFHFDYLKPRLRLNMNHLIKTADHFFLEYLSLVFQLYFVSQRWFQNCQYSLPFWHSHFSWFSQVRRKKNRYFRVRLTTSVYPPPLLRSVFCEIFLVCFLSQIMILCVPKHILHKKKVIFIQLLISPILPYCLLLLSRKFVKQQYSGGVNDIKNAFLRPLTMR